MPVALSVPAAEMEKSQWDALKAQAVQKLKEAIASKGKNPDDYDYLDLLPTDIGFSNDVFSHDYSAANTYEELTSATLPDDKFVAIFGVYNKSASPLTTKIRFWKGSIPIREYWIDKMYVEDVPKAALGPIVVYSESDSLKIEGYASDTGTDELGFIGINAVKKKEVVSM